MGKTRSSSRRRGGHSWWRPLTTWESTHKGSRTPTPRLPSMVPTMRCGGGLRIRARTSQELATGLHWTGVGAPASSAQSGSRERDLYVKATVASAHPPTAVICSSVRMCAVVSFVIDWRWFVLLSSASPSCQPTRRGTPEESHVFSPGYSSLP